MKIFLMLALATLIHNFRSDYKNPSVKEEFIFIKPNLKATIMYLEKTVNQWWVDT